MTGALCRATIVVAALGCGCLTWVPQRRPALKVKYDLEASVYDHLDYACSCATRWLEDDVSPAEKRRLERDAAASYAVWRKEGKGRVIYPDELRASEWGKLKDNFGIRMKSHWDHPYWDDMAVAREQISAVLDSGRVLPMQMVPNEEAKGQMRWPPSWGRK